MKDNAMNNKMTTSDDYIFNYKHLMQSFYYSLRRLSY